MNFMNLSSGCIFVLLTSIFWCFVGFAQSEDSQQEKPETPEIKKSVEEQTDKERGEEEQEKTETESKSEENKTDEKKADSKTNQSASTSSKNSNVETLEVTGSYIRRSDIEGPSPIIVIDRDQIENSGFDSIGGFLSRHTTVLPFGGGGLRGLGSIRTLVLVNGQRIPGNGDSYGDPAASPDVIPLAAVERIEILMDGASAIYGSDALGGVINVITRKNWDGMAVVTKLNVTDYKGGDSLRASMAYGKSSSRGSFLTSFQYFHSTPLRRSDLKRIAHFTDIRPQFSTNYIIKGESKVRPGPGCDRFFYGSELGEAWKKTCLDYLDSQHIYGASHGFNWVTDAEYEVFDDIKLYSTLYAGYGTSKETTYESFLHPPFKGPAPAGWTTQYLTPGTEVTLFHRIKELPDRVNTKEGFDAGLIVGARGYWLSDWIWDVTVNNQFNRGDESWHNVALAAPVMEALTSGTYNPFGDPAQNSTEGFTKKLDNYNRYQVNWLDAKVSGSFGSFLGIDWASAFGVSAAHFEYKHEMAKEFSSGELLGFAGTGGSGGRQLYAAFAEFNGIWRNVEGQLALRHDSYSDFGSTFNPKIAFKYQILNWLTLRTSFGTGFKAPTLQESYGSRQTYFANNQNDFRWCKEKGLKNCRPYGFEGVQGSNPDLKEETSRNFNFGMVLQPLDNLFLSLDYWNVTVDGAIGTDIQGLLRAEAINPNAPQKYGVQVIRNKDNENKIDFIDASLQNLGKEQAHGLDFNGTFKMIDPWLKGSLSLTTNLTYMFSYRRGFYEELGMEDVLGQFNRPRWRNVSSLTYSLGPLGGTLTSRTTPRVEKSNRLGHTPQFTQFDLNILYKAPWGGNFQLGAINVFKQQPEYDLSNRLRVHTPLYTPERTFFLAYREDF